jgi:proliferating cell nuclear antigen
MRIIEGSVFKKIVDAMKDLVDEANLDCSGEGMRIQAIDSSHVSLISLRLRKDGFDHFRCDRSLTLGVKLTNLAKVLKSVGNDDSITLKAEEDGDVVTMMFESDKKDRISDFEIKLMDIDAEHLGIPDTEYKCIVTMPATEFQRICRDLNLIGDSVTISVSKEGIKFSVSGDMGTGNIMLKPTTVVDKEEDAVIIEMEEPVELRFALTYLLSFTKATPLADQVTLSLSTEEPLVVGFNIGEMGYIRYYLAPKIEEGE